MSPRLQYQRGFIDELPRGTRYLGALAPLRCRRSGIVSLGRDLHLLLLFLLDRLLGGRVLQITGRTTSQKSDGEQPKAKDEGSNKQSRLDQDHRILQDWKKLC